MDIVLISRLREFVDPFDILFGKRVPRDWNSAQEVQGVVPHHPRPGDDANGLRRGDFGDAAGAAEREWDIGRIRYLRRLMSKE